ncbi:MAG: hypothetical protein K0Q73_9175 [Paenibacillus sp.]|jgi:hypothetical protein|nr:hypothetical protein [Paenibacillus sp.]
MLTFVGIASSALYLVLLPAILVFGLIQCKKHSFKGGFYFFSLYSSVRFIHFFFLMHFRQNSNCILIPLITKPQAY